LQDSTYNNSSYSQTDGGGFSLMARDPTEAASSDGTTVAVLNGGSLKLGRADNHIAGTILNQSPDGVHVTDTRQSVPGIDGAGT
jgi:hypothetical protein